MVENWFNLWKNKQIAEGKEVSKEMYSIDENSYMATGEVTPEEYINNSSEVCKEANAEFEKEAEKVPWTAKMKHENSPEFVKLMQDQNYEKITINKETLVDNLNKETFLMKNAEEKGLFVSRVPGTWGDNMNLLILPKNQVFTTDEDKTYIAFINKGQSYMVADVNGKVTKKGYEDIREPYDKVNRNFSRVNDLRQGKGLEQTKDTVKDAVSKTVPPIIPKV